MTQQKVYLYTKINGCVHVTHLNHKKLQTATHLLTAGLEVRLERDSRKAVSVRQELECLFFSSQNEVPGETGPGLAQVRAGMAFMPGREVPALGSWPTGRKDMAS